MSRKIIPITATFQFPFGNQTGRVNAFLVVDGGKAVLVDTLVQGKEQDIEKALQDAGLAWDAIGHIIITHAHPDHTGSLAAVLAHVPDAEVHAADSVGVPATPARDGDVVAGLKVVEAPGHTPGSIALYDVALSAMLLGDAAMNEGQLSGPPPMFSKDLAQGMESLKKITQFDFDQAFFGHGVPLDKDASTELRQFAAS